MKRYLISILLILIISLSSYSQELTWENPTYQKDNFKYELYEITKKDKNVVKVTEYKDGLVKTEGYFIDGKNHGIWKSYHKNKLISVIKYNYGKKVWLKLYKDNKNIYVEFINNKPAEVTYQLALN